MTDSDKPLASLVEAEKSIDPPVADPSHTVDVSGAGDLADEPEATTDRLRIFENHILGPDHIRPNGKIERGSGSKFFSPSVTPEQRAHHAALEALIEAEAEHKKAGAIEDAAHAKLEAAIKRAEDTEGAL